MPQEASRHKASDQTAMGSASITHAIGLPEHTASPGKRDRVSGTAAARVTPMTTIGP